MHPRFILAPWLQRVAALIVLLAVLSGAQQLRRMLPGGGLQFEAGDVQRGVIRVKPGDDSSWATATLADGSWLTPDSAGFAAAMSQAPITWWMRETLTLDRAPRPTDRSQRLYLQINQEAEVFWDGIRISAELPAGRYGTTPESRLLELTFPPESLAAGPHHVAIRFPHQQRTRNLSPEIELHAGDAFLVGPGWEVVPAGDPRGVAPDNEAGISAARPAHKASFLTAAHAREEVPGTAFWIRRQLIVTPQAGNDDAWVLFESFKGAREVRWAGRLIGTSGRVGTDRATEVPGRARMWHSIPAELFQPGRHLITMRVSSHHPRLAGEGLLDDFEIWRQKEVVSRVVRAVGANHVQFGLALVSAVLFLVLYGIVERRSTYLAFSLCCWGAVLSLGAGVWWAHTFETLLYPQERWIVWLNWTGSALGAAMLVNYTVLQLRAGARWCWNLVGALGIGLAFFGTTDPTARSAAMFAAGAGLAAGVGVVRLPNAARDATWLIIGLGMLLITLMLEAGEAWGMAGLILSAAFVLGRELREQRLARQAATLRNAELETERARLEALRARAEAELLKASIQPHFIINTLTALMEWVEEDPAGGIRFIQAIEQHFDLLLRCANQSLIPITHELSLCRAFLKIVGFRKLVDYTLATDGITPEEFVPPLLFHTLVENGVTHQDGHRGPVEFRLLGDESSECRRYRFFAPYAPTGSADPVRKGRGVGLGYARARLEEAYPGRWSLRSQGENDCWVTTIEITAAPRSLS